jgi:hypothetical protein
LDAIWLFGTVGIGFVVPESCLDQNARGEPWTVVTTGTKLLGGHYVPAVRWDGTYLDTVTWGSGQYMSPQFLVKYNDESVAYLSHEMIRADGSSLEGFDLAGLGKRLENMAA